MTTMQVIDRRGARVRNVCRAHGVLAGNYCAECARCCICGHDTGVGSEVPPDKLRICHGCRALLLALGGVHKLRDRDSAD